jgi:hypothetical protein
MSHPLPEALVRDRSTAAEIEVAMHCIRRGSVPASAARAVIPEPRADPSNLYAFLRFCQLIGVPFLSYVAYRWLAARHDRGGCTKTVVHSFVTFSLSRG